MSNELSIRMDQDKIELLKRTVCKGASNDELELFIHACNRTGLDPFMKQIYAVKRYTKNGEVMTIQTGIDGYRLIAERSGRYMPGRECTFTYENNALISATGYVKKMDSSNTWHEIAHTVYWNEYVPKTKEGIASMWRDKPHVMLSKCAESAVLRKAFPADLSGLYTTEEMGQAEEPVEESNVKVIGTAAKKEYANQINKIKELIGEDEELLSRVLSHNRVYRLEDIPTSEHATTVHFLSLRGSN